MQASLPGGSQAETPGLTFQRDASSLFWQPTVGSGGSVHVGQLRPATGTLRPEDSYQTVLALKREPVGHSRGKSSGGGQNGARVLSRADNTARVIIDGEIVDPTGKAAVTEHDPNSIFWMNEVHLESDLA